MYNNTVKSAKIKLVISLILSVALTLFMFVFRPDGLIDAQNSQIDGRSFLIMIFFAILAVIIETFAWYGFLINWKKILIGCIKPIPILSMFIEFLKGYWMAFRTLIWLIPNWKNE